MSKEERTILVRRNRYKADAGGSFPSSFIFEKTASGVLVTELDPKKGVLDQEYLKTSTPEQAISKLMGTNFKLVPTKELPRTTLSVGCPTCGAKLIRELDFVEPELIEEVPVAPIFRCTKCDKRFYSITRTYLERLVDRKAELFDEKELEELRKDRETFINTLNEYIIRIFASKRIHKIVINE